MCVHWLVCIQSSVVIFTCWDVLRALRVSARHCVWISSGLSACGCTYSGLVMYLLASASFKGCECIHLICTYVPAFIALYQGDEHEFASLAVIESWAFLELYQKLRVCLHVSQISRAGSVSSYVGRYHEHSMFQHCVCTYWEPGMSLNHSCIYSCVHQSLKSLLLILKQPALVCACTSAL
jgi:hypothetical protein